MDLRWLASLSTSSLHAAAAFAHGHLFTNTQLAEVIAEPTQQLRQTITASGMPESVFWRNLVGLSGTIDSSSQLAEVAVRKTRGPTPTNTLDVRLAAHIAAIQSAVRQAFPELVDELAIRTGPLRRQWEAIGPGLLNRVVRLSDQRLMAPNADVLLVQPALGGGGAAHLLFNSVRIEAVVTNSIPELPEVLRLAWLLAQLNLDLPVFSNSIHGHRLPQMAELAVLPLVLKAAESAELATLDRETLNLALNAWHLATPPDIDAVDQLWRWWETYAATRSTWSVAFAALDRMFS